MRLFIAEKPSLGRAIAEGIGITTKYDTHIICKDDTVVTWCFGHILEQYMPEDYDEKYKSWREIPVIPKVWKKKPAKKCEKQLNAISKLLAETNCVVNAGDPDREGQLIVDEVLEFCGYTGKCLRIWLSALDDKSVAKALSDLRDNADYLPLQNAAQARSQADWLIGLNATRALTNLGRDSGFDQVLSLGRVQTPVLALVVNRDRSIANFKPQDYLVLEATFEHKGGTFKGKFQPGESQEGLDPEGRLISKEIAGSIAKAVRGKQGAIADLTQEDKIKKPPLPYNLSQLQKEASAKLGYTAHEVLDICQSLYEKKLTSYPRTDCRYLPIEQFSEAPDIIETLTGVTNVARVAQGADSSLKSQAWNTAKVTAHHAIIPTGIAPKGLSEKEAAIYEMIACVYLLQFWKPMKYTAQRVVVTVNDYQFEARGRVIIEAGWTEVSHDAEDDKGKEDKDDVQALPKLFAGDSAKCLECDTLAKKTKPLPHFTEGTLIDAMSGIHRYIEDPEAKKVLKENEGIGTEATRADVIEKLKHCKYLQPKGKQLLATDLACQVIDLTPDALKDPVTTAKWETRLTEMANGQGTVSDFMQDQIARLPGLLDPILTRKPDMKPKGPVHKCPVCQGVLRRLKGKFGYYWLCGNAESHPDKKPVTLPDVNGKPGNRGTRDERESVFKCPDCGGSLKFISGTRKDGESYEFFSCPACDKRFNSKDGQPDTSKKSGRVTPTDFTCFFCKKPLNMVSGEKNGEAYEFFACTGCHETFKSRDGKPQEKAKTEKTKFKCPLCKKPLVKREFTRKSDGVKFFKYNCTGYPACKGSFFEGPDGKPDFGKK